MQIGISIFFLIWSGTFMALNCSWATEPLFCISSFLFGITASFYSVTLFQELTTDD